MISTDGEAKASPASASSSTLFITPLPSSSDSKDSLTLPKAIPRSTKALRPSSLSISLPISASSSPPPQRMSGKGFVEPHRSHLPRRANTTKSRGSVKVETPARKAFRPPSNPRLENDNDDEEDPFAISSPPPRRHSGVPSTSANGHMPTHLLSLRIPEPTPSSVPPQTPPRTPPRIPVTPAQTPKGHLEPQSANLPRRHQRSGRAAERDGSPVSKVRHARSLSRSRLGTVEKEEEMEGFLAEERRSKSGRSGLGPPLRVVEAVKAVEEPLPRSRTCLQEMGKGTGVFVGFLPHEITEEESPLHVVVQSNAEKLVLPLPPLPSPIESSGPTHLWSKPSFAEDRGYLDGVTALTDAQLHDGCSFIERATRTPRNGLESSSRVRIYSPRLRPEEAMSLAICYLAYSSPASVSVSSRPLPSSSNPIPDSSAPPSSVDDEDVFTAGAARLIPSSANLTPEEQRIRTRKLSFPGSWDDELVDIDIINVDPELSTLPNPTPKFNAKEPKYTPAHALYMHLHDDIDSEVDLEREMWDAVEEETFMHMRHVGRLGLAPVGVEDVDGELEQGISEPSTDKVVFGARGSACNPVREAERDGDADADQERGMGREYKCIRAEWRGVLSFDGLKRLDGVWGGAGSC